MTAYYNEIDSHAAQWLRNLISAGHIAPGEVDERSIEDVHPRDLDKFVQCHFFAGIAVWSHALRSVGWPDSRQVWTGSCPCQPFSAAGKGAGFTDERHLWPAFNHLISQCKPSIVLGEQVASKDGLDWLDLVLTDLEAQGYAAGAVDTCAAGYGASHIRQRLYWVGHSGDKGLEGYAGHGGATRRQGQARPVTKAGVSCRMADTQQHDSRCEAKPANHAAPQTNRPADWIGGCGGASGGMADSANQRLHRGRASEPGDGRNAPRIESERLLDAGRLADSDSDGCQSRRKGGAALGYGQAVGADSGACWLADTEGTGRIVCDSSDNRPPDAQGNALADTGDCANDGQGRIIGPAHRPGPTNGFWRAADWLGCLDGKWRPVEPGTFPLAHGLANRMGCTCANCETETVIYENMPFLRKIGVRYEGRFSKEVLQRRMLSAASSIDSFEKQEFSSFSGENSGATGVMKQMREFITSTSPPQRQKSDEQPAGKFGSSLLSMPSLGTLEGTILCLRSLWAGIQGGISPKQEQDLFCAVCERVGPHKCVEEVVGPRTAKLRAYGNSLCAEQAKGFIEAVMDYQ